MTLPACPITGEPLINPGQTISLSAANRLVTAAKTLPVLIGDVQYALGGLRSGDSGGGRTTSEAKTPVNLALLEQVDEMRDSINSWAIALLKWAAPQVELQKTDPVTIASVLAHYTPKALTWEESPQLVDEVLYSIRRLENLASIKRSPSLTFCGYCLACDKPVWARIGEDTTECECGMEINAQASILRLKESLRNAEPCSRKKATQIAEILTGRSIPAGTVRQWIHRGRLHPVSEDLFKPGDIAELAGGINVRYS